MANVLLGIHCVVPGCTSTLRKVNQWKARPCLKPKHKGKTQSQCMCPEPYQFFKFPSEIKLQKLWLERVRRPDLEINNLTRVCSLHFAEGKPTRRNYFPNINLHTRAAGEDQDNEGDEGKAKRRSEEPRPSPAKISRRGGGGEGVSVVPMDLLQEEEDEYEGDLTISRYSYHRHIDDNAGSNVYETVSTPTNTVTITRVTTSTKSSTGNGPTASKVDNRLTSSVESRKIPAPRVIQRTTTASSQHAPKPSSSKMKRYVEVPEENEEFDYPYEIDMVEEDADGSEELSDEGVETQPGQGHTATTSSVVERYSLPSAPVTIVHSQSDSKQTFRQAAPTPVQSNTSSQSVLVKPKLIPVLAVAPKTQQHPVIQPLAVMTRVQQTAQMPRKITPVQPKQQVSQNAPIVSNGNPGTSTTTTNTVSNTTLASSGVGTGNLQATSQKPLATYDPSKQQLQIANPVKYIQECHTRIADLAAENDRLKTRNNELNVEVQELQKSNKELRREIVQHQAKRPVSVPVSTINIVPKSEPVTLNPVASTTPTKTRIRYMIRRPMQ